MSFWVLVLLCLVQGLTEFLPVSSSGHLLLLEQIFGIEGNLLLLNLFLHLSTLLAVLIVYRKVIWNLIKKPFQPLSYKLLISTIFTLIFAFSYEIFDIDAVVTKFYFLCFFITSVLLFISSKFQKKASIVRYGEISYKSAIIVGVVQGFAVLPGISRSGSTISSLLLLGEDENKSAEYSFLLSVPIIIGGFVLEILKAENIKLVLGSLSLFECVFAFVFTFFVSIISLKITIKLLKNNKFGYFAIYLIFVSVVAFIINYVI